MGNGPQTPGRKLMEIASCVMMGILIVMLMDGA